MEAIYDPRRISAIEASTKSGKTHGCIVWLVEEAILGGGEGRNYWWIAPVATQADIAFTRMRRYLPRGMFEAARHNKTITLPNGAIIWFKGADRPDTLYGDDVHGAVIDEASRLKEEAWLAVRTTLTATRGRMRIIGNVKGRKNWFYRLARRAELGAHDMGYHRISAYDAVEAGVLAGDEIADAKEQMPAHAFRELFLAQPSNDEGNPFGAEAIEACIGPMSSGRPQVWGWDLGKHVDWTVGIALDQDGQVCRLERFRLPWRETIDSIQATTGSVPALIDSTGVGDPIVEMLQRNLGANIEGYQFTAPSKQKLMEGLAVAIQSRTVRIPDGPIVIELSQFEYEYHRTGIRYSAPEGMHDDCVCALALAVMHRSHVVMPVVVTSGIIAEIMRAPRMR